MYLLIDKHDKIPIVPSVPTVICMVIDLQVLLSAAGGLGGTGTYSHKYDGSLNGNPGPSIRKQNTERNQSPSGHISSLVARSGLVVAKHRMSVYH